MKKDLGIVLSIFFITLVFWSGAFLNFFAQDDFIFIEHFSQNNLLTDIKNVFGPPTVTHWRPFHNLYFLIAGNVFGKNYVGYHLLTTIIHVASGFFIFKIWQILTGSGKSAFAGALFYVVHPAHFVSMFWIAGSATSIGFLFWAASIWSYLTKRKLPSFILIIFALLASEAMLPGLVVFAALGFFKKQQNGLKFLSVMAFVSLVFVFIKLIFTSVATFEIYKIEVSPEVLEALRYYVLRILGFAETSGDKLSSALVTIFWFLIFISTGESFLKNHKKLILPVVTIVGGFFPFILLPSHTSPHYMNISIWGLSMIMALAVRKMGYYLTLLLLIFFIVISVINIELTRDNNWVIKRSNLAKRYIERIEDSKLANDSKIIFSGDQSFEAYVTLGQGRAIDWWFRDKNYENCFTFLQKCEVGQLTIKD